MARTPRPPTYREALDTLRTTHLTLQNILSSRLNPAVRAELQTLFNMIDRLLVRDDGRVR